MVTAVDEWAFLHFPPGCSPIPCYEGQLELKQRAEFLLAYEARGENKAARMKSDRANHGKVEVTSEELQNLFINSTQNFD